MPPKSVPQRGLNQRSVLSIVGACALIAFGSFIAGRISSSSDSERAADAQLDFKQRPGADFKTPDSRSDRMRPRSTSSEPHGSPKSNLSYKGGNPRECLTSIYHNNDPLERSRMMLALIDSLSPDEFEKYHDSMIDLFDSRISGGGSEFYNEYSQFVTAWAKADPQGALTHAANKDQLGMMAVNCILNSWAKKDPDAAIKWAEENHTGAGENPYMSCLVGAIAAQDIDRANQLLSTISGNSERTKAVAGMMRALNSKGVDAIIEWFGKQTDESIRSSALFHSAGFIAESDPVAATELLMANRSRSTTHQFGEVYKSWAKKDQTAAIESLSALPAGAERSYALQGIVEAISANSTQEANEMLDRFSDDVDDTNMAQLIARTTATNPTFAISQIHRIENEVIRNNMYVNTLSDWKYRDPAAAQAWIESNALPPKVLTNLRR